MPFAHQGTRDKLASTADNEGMAPLTEPQVWTLIGVFAAIMVGALSLMTTLIMRSITVATDGLRSEVVARFEKTDAKFEAMDAKFEAMGARSEARFEAVEYRFQAMDARFDAMDAKVDARFETIAAKLEHLDRDVTALMRRAWGEPTSD
jgi:hypothetical protein